MNPCEQNPNHANNVVRYLNQKHTDMYFVVGDALLLFTANI